MCMLARIQVAALLLVAPLSVAGQKPDIWGEVHSAPMEVIHGKPYVMAMVNGKGPFRFLIDTGTGADAIVSTELAAELELPAMGETRLSDPSGEGGTAPIRVLDTLTLGGIDFHSVRSIEHTLLKEVDDCQGMLGFTFFRDYLLTLDYPNARITFADAQLQPDGDKLVHPFRLENGVPIARLNIGDLTVEAEIDSGGMGLSFPERLAAQMRFQAGPTLLCEGRSIITRYLVKVAQLATDVRFGEVTFEDPWVEINPTFPLANFGSIPLHNFVVSFDQENLLMSLDGPQKRVLLDATPVATQPGIRLPGPLPSGFLVPIG